MIDEFVVDFSEIDDSVKNQKPIEITTYTLPREMEDYIRNVLSAFLESCALPTLYKYFDYCLNELLSNAKKANTKRVFFKDKNLNIDNISEYEEGMLTFKNETFEKLNYYLDLQEKAGLYVKLSLLLKDNVITIDIRNNSVLTEVEQRRVTERLANVHQYTVEELMGDVVDQTEGAGIGINSVGLMMQKLGLSTDSFTIFVEGNETVSRIVCPIDQLLPEYTACDDLEEI